MNRCRPLLRVAVAIALAFPLAFDAGAATRTWTGTVSTLWSDPQNWGGTAPVAGDDLVFPVFASRRTSVNDFAAETTFASITITGGGTTLQGNAVKLSAASALTVAPTSFGAVRVEMPVTYTSTDARASLSAMPGTPAALTLAGTTTVAGGKLSFVTSGNLADVMVTGSIAESGSAAGIVLAGDGVVELLAANSYSGITRLQGGLLLVWDSASLGAGDNTAATGTVIQSAARLVLVGALGIPSERLTDAYGGGGSPVTIEHTGAGEAVWGGDIDSSYSGIVLVLHAPLTVTGRLGNGVSISVREGTLTLANPANAFASLTAGSYTGQPVRVVAAAADVLGQGSSVNVGDNGELDLAGFDQSVWNLYASGVVTVGNGTLRPRNGNVYGNLTTGPSGRIVLETGATFGVQNNALGAYTLQIDGGRGGTSGTRKGARIVLNSGEYLASGEIGSFTSGAGPGTIRFSSGYSVPVLVAPVYSQSAGTTLKAMISSMGYVPSAFIASPAATLSGPLEIELGYGRPSVGSAYVIIDNTGGGRISGTFAGLPEGATLLAQGVTFRISYAGGDGNDAVATVVSLPVPPAFTTPAALPDAISRSYYTTSVTASGGNGRLDYSAVSYGPTFYVGYNGTISGTPPSPGTYAVTARVTDALGYYSDRTFSIRARSPLHFAVWRPSSARFYVDDDDDRLADSATVFGAPTDVPLIGRIDDNVFADLVVFRGGRWYADYDGDGHVDFTTVFGAPNDVPLLGDMDGDGRDELVVYRNGVWYVSQQRSGNVSAVYRFGGQPGDVPLLADMNADGRADLVVFRGGLWFVDLDRDGFPDDVYIFGGPNDRPLVADWDNDGNADLLVFRQGVWHVNVARRGVATASFVYGAPGDVPFAFRQ